MCLGIVHSYSLSLSYENIWDLWYRSVSLWSNCCLLLILKAALHYKYFILLLKTSIMTYYNNKSYNNHLYFIKNSFIFSINIWLSTCSYICPLWLQSSNPHYWKLCLKFSFCCSYTVFPVLISSYQGQYQGYKIFWFFSQPAFVKCFQISWLGLKSLWKV